MIRKINQQSGVSLYFIIIVMAILLAMALGINNFLIGRIKMIEGIEDSLSAFYAADTGAEWMLYNTTSTRPYCQFDELSTSTANKSIVVSCASTTPAC